MTATPHVIDAPNYRMVRPAPTSPMLAAYANPMRPPTWRWLRAMQIADGVGPTATKRRDSPQGAKWINAAVRFLRQYRSQADMYSEYSLAEAFPGIYWAHRLWSDAASASTRASLEARILARVDFPTIAESYGMSLDLVIAYEALFFNVVDRLNNQSYILHGVIGEAITRGLSESEYHVIWKLFAYFCGPRVLDAIETRFSNPTWCDSVEMVDAALQDDLISTLYQKAAIAVKMIGVHGGNQLALLDQFVKYAEIKRSGDGDGGDGQTLLLQQVGAVMQSFNFTVGGYAPGGKPPIGSDPTREFIDNTAVELSNAEVIQVSTQPLPYAKTLADLQFPAE